MLPLKEEEKKWVEDIWGKIDNKLMIVSERSRNKIPYKSVDGMHDDKSESNINWWTNGFWPGMMWLMYAGTKKECYRETAQAGEKALEAGFDNYERLSHDVGFIWRLAAGPDYTLTGSETARKRQLFAADHLMSRYNVAGEFIRAWNHGKHSSSEAGMTIIDTMMNLPLLYWMSDETKDPRFRMVAEKHADTTIRDHIRSDYSINHIVNHNPYTGEKTEVLAGQGYEVNSSWSRGQAWALYGFVISYIHTGKEEYLTVAKNTAHYFISNVCDNWIPKCDFRSPETPVIYDTSAGVCAACGMIEIAKIVPEHEKRMYLNAALEILKTIEANFADWSDKTDFIIDKATCSYTTDIGRNIIYADYFFTEAIYKCMGFEPLFW